MLRSQRLSVSIKRWMEFSVWTGGLIVPHRFRELREGRQLPVSWFSGRGWALLFSAFLLRAMIEGVELQKAATSTALIDDGSKVIEGVIWIHPERVSGAPCFINTRVPIQNLFDYIEGGEPLDEFLEGFPPITREQAIKVLEFARTGLFNSLLNGE